MDGGDGDVGPYFDAIIDKYAMDTIKNIGVAACAGWDDMVN